MKQVYFTLRAFSVALLYFSISIATASIAMAQTNTFVDRHQANDIRVVSYNVEFEMIFPEVNPVQAAKFGRVVRALDADVINIQEISSHSAADVVSLLNNVAPLDGGATWIAHQGGDNVIASKYPLSMTATNTIPAKDGTAIALVDLPDNQYGADMYFMNNHFTCCSTTGPDEPEDPFDTRERDRQREADALVNWMRDARTAGDNVTLPNNTPMLVVGDLNIVNDSNVYDPLGTLLHGDIFFEGTYGADSPPDWDGTSLADANPLHNGSGADDYTWRNDSSPWPATQIDFILYTDSVLQSANRFVLNTVAMSAADRAANGLQEFDVTQDLSGVRYDHLPVVTDFRLLVDAALAGDYDENGVVDAADYTVWLDTLGSESNLAADGSGNGLVDSADYGIWKSNFGATLPGSASGSKTVVPEPANRLLVLSILFIFATLRNHYSRTHGLFSLAA